MASGFISGRALDFFTGQSMNQAPQPSYRSNLPSPFLDPSTQIACHQQQPQQPHTIIEKRTLSDYQAHQFQNQAGLNGFLYLSVRPHTYTSPISPLSPMDFSKWNLPQTGQNRINLRFATFFFLVCFLRCGFERKRERERMGFCGF